MSLPHSSDSLSNLHPIIYQARFSVLIQELLIGLHGRCSPVKCEGTDFQDSIHVETVGLLSNRSDTLVSNASGPNTVDCLRREIWPGGIMT